jgi:hypothetical protein
MADMGLQMGNLLLTTCSLICALQFSDTKSTLVLDHISKFLVENLDTEQFNKTEVQENNPLDALDMLCTIDTEVMSLVQDYAQVVYQCAFRRDNPGAIPPPLILSKAEMYRMRRVFYRLNLFDVLYYDCSGRSDIDSKPFYIEFFKRLSAFEIDELVAAYGFVYQECCWNNVDSEYKEHPIASSMGQRGIEPLKRYRARCTGSENTPSWFTRSRVSQPVWFNFVMKGFIDRNGLWANLVSSRCMPIKSWDDAPEANERNKGWLSWCKVRDNPNWGINRHACVRHHRNLGYCFWDGTRLAGWGSMFQESWLSEELVNFTDNSRASASHN